MLFLKEALCMRGVRALALCSIALCALAWASTANADGYTVPTSAASSTSIKKDGVCNLAEALASLNLGAPVNSDCKKTLSEGNDITLSQTSAVKFADHHYQLAQGIDLTVTFNGTVGIFTSDGATAYIDAVGQNALTVERGVALDVWNVVFTHKGTTPGRLIFNWGQATFTYCTFQGGNPDYSTNDYPDGGAILNYGDVSVNNCLIQNNSAPQGYGGGIALYSSSNITIANTGIQNNVAGYAGGGVYSELTSEGAATLTLNQDQLTNNKVTSGDGGGLWGRTDVTRINNSTFSGNHASGSGGGIYIAADSLGCDVTTSTLSGNTANDGGGLFSNNNLSVNMELDTISGNVAQHKGGGIYGGSYLELVDITVAFNQAVSFDNSQPTVGSGGGVFMPNGGGRAVGCIFSNNFHGSSTHVPDDYAGSPHSGHTDSASLFMSTNYTQSVAGNDITGKDPHLAALASNGGPTKTHAITNTSAAYNADDNVASGEERPTDQRGLPRPKHGKLDIGSYELQ